jgi:4-hydroxy-2-oxoglutarate aldolase
MENNHMNLQGVFPALTTPFANDGSLALDKLQNNLALYNRLNLSGYLSVGSTGESVLLDYAEVQQIWETTRKAAAPGKILIAGTGVDSTQQTIARTRRAAEIGFDFALVKTPYYFKPQMTPTALEEHFRRVADASPIPILIYAVPQYTGITVTSDLVARLASHPNVVGIKESSGNVQLATEIVSSTAPEFRVLVGSGSAFFPSLAVGVAGGILALACFLPDQCVQIYEAAQTGDFAKAANVQKSVLTASRKIVAETGIPGVKYAMDAAGYYGGPPRAPFQPLTATQREAIDTSLAGLLPSSAAAHPIRRAD